MLLNRSLCSLAILHSLLMLLLAYASITRYNILDYNALDHSLGILGSDVLCLGARKVDVLLSKVQLTSEGGVRLPLAGGTGCGLLQHLVYLLERETLGFRNLERTISTGSVVRYLQVELTRKYAKTKEIQHSPPHMKKTLEPRLAECFWSLTR